MKWYVLQVMTGSERDVCTALRRKAEGAAGVVQTVRVGYA